MKQVALCSPMARRERMKVRPTEVDWAKAYAGNVPSGCRVPTPDDRPPVLPLPNDFRHTTNGHAYDVRRISVKWRWLPFREYREVSYVNETYQSHLNVATPEGMWRAAGRPRRQPSAWDAGHRTSGTV